MKKQIWKYEIRPGQTIYHLPKNAEILSVQEQDEMPHIWALVDPYAKTEERYLEIYGTGHDLHFDMGIERKFIGTFQLKQQGLVFHLFERIN